MHPSTFAFRPALRPYVASMQHYDLDGYPPGEHVGLPSATITLIIALDPGLELSLPGQQSQHMTSCLAGIHDGPVTIHHNGTQRGLQIALTPLGLHALLGVPASAVAHLAVGLEDVLGRPAERLLEQIASEPDWSARLRLVEAALLARVDAMRRGGPRPELIRAWTALAETGGAIRIDTLADEVGWSGRHLTQQFVAAVGAGPKTIARIVRFQRSVGMVGRGHDLAGLAMRCHYADQAHLTREWRRLAGTSPTRWRRDDVLANVQDS